MEKLTVLYDPHCGFCRRCKEWLELQPKLLELELIPADSDEAARRYPSLEGRSDAEELIVVSDEGAVYRGGHAFIMCLYALEKYREWSYRLAAPVLLPLARRVFGIFSNNRRLLTGLLGLRTDEDLAKLIERRIPPEVGCS